MSAARIAGLVLAGGRGSRLGASVPKPLVEVRGRPMIAHVLDRIPAAVAPILLGANEVEAFAGFLHPVVPDRVAGFRGPLAALDAASDWLQRSDAKATHLLCLPGDTPFLPVDVAERLARGAAARPRIARCRGRLHPTAAVWPLDRLKDLELRIRTGHDLSVRGLAEECDGLEPVDFDPSADAPDGDPFFNINTAEDLARARAAAALRM